MSDAEIPDADAQEQQQTLDDPAVLGAARLDIDTGDIEVPEADALEQAAVVPASEDDDR